MTLLTHSFLISFMVDARGGAMKGRRHSGIRIIIPPNRASMPTRVTCRLIKKDKLIHPIPIGEGEALAARIIEMGPVATKFLGRILIEIPHFASLRGKEREIKIMRSTNGDKWEEHPIVATDDAVQKALSESMEDLDYEDELAGKRVTRILTDDFPRYFALVTKVREEKQWVGEEGLILSSTVVPQVQAVFPKGAVNKNIKVGLQAQPVSPELVSKLLGNRVAVSPIVTLEPRRRRFHTAITLTIPVPKAAQKGMINQYENEAPTLRVMYSIAASNNALREGTNPALWDDLTDQTQLTFIDDCVSFNTNVSGRFMLMDCQNVADACRFATELYREAIIVPYMARFVVFAKRTGEEEGKLRMFCMTDDRIDKTLEKQENFREVARSRDVEVLEGRPQYVEMAGNLIPITKSGDQLYISFKAFRENRLPCLVKIRDRDQEPAARVAFMKEPKVVRGELPQTPICNLNIALPDMSTSSSMEMDPEAALELKKRSSLLREHGIVVEDTVTKAKINLSDVADTLKGDWVILATQLDISGDEIHKINSDYRTVNDQALAMLSLWKEKKGEQATGNELERALRSIKREDVVQKCMYNVECITDEVELAAAKVAMDQSGFDTFAEEIGATQDSMKRNMSLDVQFDEQEVQKLSDSEESESVADSPASAPQAYEEEEVRAQQAAVNELAARLSTAEETAEHPGETEKHEEVIDSQMVQTSESAARQTTMDVGETDVDTGLPYVADQKEPDMGKLVESLRTDLYEKEKTEKSGNESDVSSIASSDTEGEFNIEPLPSTAPETVSKDPVADRRSSVERKRKRTDSLSSSSLSDVEDNGEESVEENTKVEKEPVKPKSSLHDGSRHEPKTGHVHFRKEDLPSSSSSSSSSSSTEDESNQIDTEAKSPDLATPKIDRMEEFHFAEKPGIERKEEKGSEDKGDIPVKVYKPSLTAQDTIEEGLKMLPDNIEGTEDVKPIADSDVEKQIVKAPAPPKEKESSSSSSSSDEDGEDKRPAEDFREGSVERIERYEEVPPKEQTHARSPTENQEPVQDQELLSAGGDTGDGPQFTKTAKRLKRMSSLQQQEVIDSELVEEEESTVEQVLTDGSKVTRKRFKSGDSIKSENGEPECMELVEEEGPEKEDVKYEENEEILEDGTVHRISRTRRQSLKHVKRTLISESGEEENIFDDDVAVPGKAKEDVIEVFEEPAKPVTQVEEVEVIKNDGRVVKKRMVMNRMVSNVKTFHQSFDDSGNLQEDEYEIEAIIPGTESAFVEGEDTTSSSSSGSSSDDNDENDEEIDVDDLDLVEEDCQSGTTVTSRQVIKQTFTSTTYETDEPKELDETGLVKRIVKKVTYDPKQPEVVCDSSEYDDEVVLAIETPLITITEDNSKPANEGDDHLAYFGYRCSQESLKEEENSKSVAEIVHMFEKDSQKQNAAKPDIVQISDSDELSEGKVSNIKEQSAMYFAEKEIIIVEKNKSEALTESQNEYTQDDTKPIKVHRMVEIFEKISSQSSVDETGVERQLPVLYDNSNVGFESMSEQNKDIEAEKTQSVDEVDEQELEILGESEETITKNQMREPETQQEMKKPDELKYTNISQEFGIVEETTSPLVIETVSPVAKIVEDIESNVSRIQEATIKEQVVPTEQVTEVHTKDLEPQYLSSSDEIYYEKIVNVSEETQFADEIASSTEEMLEEFEQCYPNKMNATETVENEEKLSSEKDISPECEQQSVVEDICDQNEVSEAAKETLEPTCLSSLSIQIVEQHSDEQLIEEENEMTISKTEVQKISPTSNLEDFSAIESRSDDIETIKYPHTDKEFPPKHDGELSVEETGNKIRTETTGETSIINDFQIVHTLTEISNEQQKEEKHDTMENQDSDTSFEYPLTLQSNEEHDARETRPETHLQQMSVSHDEYEFIDDTNERLPKDVDEIKCVDDEGDEDWELLDKEEIEEALNYPDKEISYSDVGSSEQAFNISSEHPRPCIPVVDMNSESEDDISDDTTEIADRSETCDIESPIEFKQPFEKFEEVSEPKTVQFDNKVLEVKSTSTGIESSVETRDIAKESVTSIEEEDIESISSTEEYKIRKYEYDQEIKEKDTIAKQQAIHLTRLK
uniref:Ankyrin-2-like isoform X19 n=1 Tax=Crassostrea virginica TaxID=6565 RepID=A0A8B8CWV4_CRAVI|nr:ankyrin-2-like isoform X19 [Crassostrea virginica]